MKILRKTILSLSRNAASCQPHSQCPLRTLGTRLASCKLPISFAPSPNAAPNREEAERARFLG